MESEKGFIYEVIIDQFIAYDFLEDKFLELNLEKIY